MSLSRGSRSRLLAAPLGVLLVALAVPAFGQGTAPDNPFAGLPAFDEYGFQGEGEARLHDVDRRLGAVQPTAAQRGLADALGATVARWNDYGTPHVLARHGGYLSGPRAGSAVDVARAFVRENAGLFRLAPADIDALEVMQDSPLYDSPDLARVYREQLPPENPDVAHVVVLRQKFGDLESVLDGQVTVGVQRDGRVAWISSSNTGDTVANGEVRVDPADALRTAAKDVGLELGALAEGVADGLFTSYLGEGVSQPQRVRLVALPTPTQGVRRAFEVTLLETEIDVFGNPTAFITYVDAESGEIWQRTNKLEHAAQGMGIASSVNLPATSMPAAGPRGAQAAPGGGAFAGATGGRCGPLHPFEVPAGTGQIVVTAQSADNPNPDTVNADLLATIVFNGETVASADTLGNPEAVAYAPPADTLPGTYNAQICNFASGDPSFDYTGNYLLSPVGVAAGDDDGGTAPGGLPTWRVFPANPPFVSGLTPSGFNMASDTRVLWCWDNGRFPEACQEQQSNLAARVPWDVNPNGLPSFTTDGNYASTAISEASFLTPDTVANRPLSPTREYDFPWENKWFEGSCDPTQFGTVADDRNDEQASTANLFAQHNRMHDWSYFLGLTEVNGALQKTNFGNTGPQLENDPELGSSQAGRRTFNGRDNANQITLQDGVPGITNQYLWQPLTGAFYAPCVDGAYDQAVVAHEYGHAVSNRLIDTVNGTGATQGQTESWSDLVFAGYFTEFAISAGEGINPYVLGPYVTGDQKAGIRNYAMNASPLNYSNLDYDPSGLGSPHANGEIWSATNFDILTSLNATYDAEFPSSDEELQVSCARGELPADLCPGNRRWNQIQFDSFLLQPTGSTMVDSRDGMLMADMLRFDGANQDALWDAFATRGLGEDAEADGPADTDSTPSFTSPLATDAEQARVRFTAPGGVTDLRVFAGQYESSAIPVADTIAGTETGDIAAFVPGTYKFIAQAPGFGAQRFTLDLTAGTTTFAVPMRRNLASATSGAAITGDGVNLENLIDDTEATNWASLESAGTASEGKGEGAQVEGREVVVDLAGDAAVDVREIQVSAALRPVPAPPEEDEELPTDPDEGAQSRFTALRSFDVLACNAAVGDDCSTAEGFEQIFASADDAFPSTRPRPRIKDHLLRTFDVTDTQATHIKLVVRDNQCTGAPDYQTEANPDNDPLFNPDCDTEELTPDRAVLGAPFEQVRASELQVFSTASTATAPPAAAPAPAPVAPAPVAGDPLDSSGPGAAGGGQAAAPTRGRAAPALDQATVRSGASLPNTGSDLVPVALAAVLAIGVGGAFLVAARRGRLA